METMREVAAAGQDVVVCGQGDRLRIHLSAEAGRRAGKATSEPILTTAKETTDLRDADLSRVNGSESAGR